MTSSRRLSPAALALSVTALALLTACGTEGDGAGAVDQAVDPAASGEPSSTGSPTGAPTPVPDGTVRTQGLVTVLDSGDGPELCLGAVAESYPPQCGGPALEGFEFGDVGAEKAAGVTWGQYNVTGTWDGTTFTVTESIPAALYDTILEPGAGGLEPACDDATVVDADKASPEDLDATLAAASALPSYATSWLSEGIISVAVTDDPDGAEAELRKTWGGRLCVTTVERTDAELNAVNQELQVALGDQLLSSGSTSPDSLDATVVFDDGSIQDWADATWGDGLVRVSSALEPAE
ncbi:hypothetical protein L2K70_02750 [Nocardioides KLBMP 9356]|uniref:Uncharacterized protein n=1 Tax=Nocardioides potassii TaxID=2911371 RepID=A0ABS9H8C1_9ACTN|nr:hypothetical protein [Nocardioides potassii]MCF6376512.1 hypothetical protein [Nocardioides potassii]